MYNKANELSHTEMLNAHNDFDVIDLGIYNDDLMLDYIILDNLKSRH